MRVRYNAFHERIYRAILFLFDLKISHRVMINWICIKHYLNDSTIDSFEKVFAINVE